MSKIYPLKGKVQHYTWGGHTFIPELLGLAASEKPSAEYWMGAHVKAPSNVVTAGEEIALDQFIANNPEQCLGADTFNKFGRLPFLFKVLDVRDMLSIQVHPTKSEAEKGFRYENELGIPLDAPNRNYKDDNHKPEIMVALSDFWLLHGFLPEARLKETLSRVPELKHLISLFESEGYFGLYKSVMKQSDEERSKILDPLLKRIVPLFKSDKLDKSSPDYWAAKASLSFDSDVPDRGIYSIYFFNIVFVKPGQAVFQDAGIPHAYLEGKNMELMANSDNVLRGGLTPKHVDVPELLKHVEFKETHPNVMAGELQSDQLERVFDCPAPDFQLSKIDIGNGDEYDFAAQTAEILVVLEGTVSLTSEDLTINLGKGEAVFVLADSSYIIQAVLPSVIYKATTPVG